MFWLWIFFLIISIIAIVFNKSQAESLLGKFEDHEKDQARLIYRIMFIVVGFVFGVISILGMLGKLPKT